MQNEGQKLTTPHGKPCGVARKVPADYTSQRCPKCGRIHKENRDRKHHEYICDACGYRSNDDRVGAMNLYMLGTMYVSGVDNPSFKRHKRK